MHPSHLTVTVIIVTMNRPDCVLRCLNCLLNQTQPVEQIVVIDASEDDATRQIVGKFDGIHYQHNGIGYGHMTNSRNLGLEAAWGDIIAFIDDDSFAEPNWREELVLPYAEEKVGAVGGRALRDHPGEATRGIDEIGLLKPSGELTGNFAADPQKNIEVTHIIGCNMSFRRCVLAELGGLREDYIGTEVREETDICLRVALLKYRIVFAPRAVVLHIGAPQVKGRRFDARYHFYSSRNHYVLLIRNFGPGSAIVRRYVLTSSKHNFRLLLKLRPSALMILGAEIVGGLAGIRDGIAIVRKTGLEPRRRDERGVQLEKWLSGAHQSAASAS